ncbi:hypothetical protein [Bacillus sp. SJS]|uniref:hypothetical protein n=1 Tax=Bacillus sp. SJS TaxID=1423321 RepID=UPI0004DCED46|nr:hypothetical protein [Bacillus sp. SJS]KZZ84430.1 hypothetical protein AS29_011295 [Bacillus sp. SJS]
MNGQFPDLKNYRKDYNKRENPKNVKKEEKDGCLSDLGEGCMEGCLPSGCGCGGSDGCMILIMVPVQLAILGVWFFDKIF